MHGGCLALPWQLERHLRTRQAPTSQNEQATSLGGTPIGKRQATTSQYDQATTLGGTPIKADVPTASLPSSFRSRTYALAFDAKHCVPTYDRLGFTATL